MPIYKMPVEEARCGAVFPGDEWSIPMFHADFPASTSKSVEVVPKLPRTIRRWIEEEKVEVLRNKKFRSVRIDQDDLDRYCAGMPDTSHPVRGEIAKLATNDESLEQRINLLIQEVARLQQRVDLLESQDPGSESCHHKASSPRASGGAESRGLPAGTLRLVPFAEQHHVTVGMIRESIPIVV
jgi:hypothetical protein